MKELGVIFVHHNTGAVTANNLALLRHCNPGVEIVTVSQWGTTFPGGYSARDLAVGPWRAYLPGLLERGWRGLPRRLLHGYERSFFWRNADLPMYLWATAGAPERAHRWVMLEWDVFCNTDLRAFYDRVWDADFAGTQITKREPHSDWAWFTDKELKRVPEKYRPHIAGIAPLAGAFLSDEVLRAVSETLRDEPVFRELFCEVRLATVAQALGFKGEDISLLATETLRGNPVFQAHTIDRPSIWHKVKDHDPMVPLPKIGRAAP